MVEAANANSPASSIVLSDAIICDEESIEIVEISQQIIRNGGETIWLLLNREIDKADIFIEFDQITIPVESIRIYGKVIIFIIPIFELPDEKSSNYGENNAVFLRVNLQKIRLPLAFLSREYINGVCNHDLSNEETSSQINSLFDFASGGDPIVLLKPVIPLFKVCDKELCNVLHVAARSKQNFALKTLLRALREYGCASDLDSIINAVNARGQTPLHCAVRAGDTDCVHYLLASGARKDMPDNNMNTVIHYLGEVYNDDIYKEIIERSNEENQIGDEEKKENPLAIKNGEGCTPVHIAVRKLKLGLLETLIEAGAPLDIADKNGETPLITALILNDIDSANLLIQSKCNVNAESQNGETPLMLACQLKNLKLIGRLIDAGADPHYANIDGKKPVDIEDSDVQKILNGERIVESDIDSTASDNNALCSSNDRSIDEQSSPPSIHRLRRIRTDDISSLDYVTRLRLSKLLDVENKWEILADHLGCSHMTQFISVCIDESSSPTMMLLDQYEQIPNANLATIIQALERMGELIGANLIKDGNE